jgi:hypothetical protein
MGFVFSTPGIAIRSVDGINWGSSNRLTVSPVGLSSPVVNGGLAFATNFFAAFNYYSPPVPPTVLTSSNGINWTSPTSVAVLPMTHGEFGYVSASGNGSLSGNRGIWTSADNLNWVWRPIDNLALSVAYGNGAYVLLCDGGVVRITTPLQPRAPLLAGRAVANGFELSMTAQPGYTYSLQRTPELLNPAWTNVYSFTSTQAVTTFLDSDATNHSASLYRLTYP